MLRTEGGRPPLYGGHDVLPAASVINRGNALLSMASEFLACGRECVQPFLIAGEHRAHGDLGGDITQAVPASGPADEVGWVWALDMLHTFARDPGELQMPHVRFAEPAIQQIARLFQMSHEEPDDQSGHRQVVAVVEQ